MLSLRNSLKTHALLIALVNASLVLLLGLVVVGSTYNAGLVDFVRTPIGDRVFSVARKIAVDLLENNDESWDTILHRESENTPFQFALLDSDGNQVAGTRMDIPKGLGEFGRNRNPQLTQTPQYDSSERLDQRFLGGNHYFWPDDHGRGYWAGLHVMIHYPGENMYGHGTLVWRFNRLWTDPDLFTVWPYATLLGGSVLITMLCWLPAIGLLLRRISKLTVATREIAKGQFDAQLPSAGRDEIGQLVESVAMMSRQLSGLLYQQQRFVSDAAHELCSPISRIRIATELLRNRERGPVGPTSHPKDSGSEPYIEDLIEDVEQMAELIRDLLLYSRARNAKLPIQSDVFNLAALVRQVLQREDLAGKDFRINMASCLRVQIPGVYLRRALANLLRNAQTYAGSAGPVEINAHIGPDGLHLVVCDQGPGIPENELGHVFAPFYRVEVARTRDTGGTGLGLAIVKSSVEACGGTVTCRNVKPHGLEVDITLPVESVVPADAVNPQGTIAQSQVDKV